jgi:hypothetical protein
MFRLLKFEIYRVHNLINCTNITYLCVIVIQMPVEIKGKHFYKNIASNRIWTVLAR